MAKEKRKGNFLGNKGYKETNRSIRVKNLVTLHLKVLTSLFFLRLQQLVCSIRSAT